MGSSPPWLRPRSRGLALLLFLAFTGASTGAAPAQQEDGDNGLPTFLAPLRADLLARQGGATLEGSPCSIGGPGDAFDGKTGTVMSTRASNPAFVEVSFARPREVLSAEVFLPGGSPHEWSLLAGPDAGHMKILVDRKKAPADHWSTVEKLGSGVTAKVWRVVARRLDGEGPVRFGEIALLARQRPVAIEIQAPSSIVCPSGNLDVRARVTFDGGYRSTSVQGLGIVAPKDAPFRIEPNVAPGSKTVTLRYEESGTSSVRARIKGKGFWLESPSFPVECRSEGLPDWSVGWIERTPRLDFDGPDGGLPSKGEAVVYVAHVKNYGTRDAGRVPYLWELDGKSVGEGYLEGIERFAEGTASLRLAEDGSRHDLRFVVNASGAIPEVGRANDEVTIQTDALRLGLWVERPILEHFHRTQASFKDGANGWEDWAQRQVRRWNRLLADARGPLAPRGVSDRVALDLVVETDEGDLPLRDGLPANDPDAADRTVDLQHGFPASLLDEGIYDRPGERSDDNPLWFDGALLRDLSLARYLVDLTRLDVHGPEVALTGPDDSPLAGSPLLPFVSGDALRISGSARVSAGDVTAGYSAHEASALQRIAGRRARGGNRKPPPDAGEYLGDLPRTCGVRVLAADGKPLDGVTVRAWRRAPGPDGTEIFAGDPVREVVTGDGGAADLCSSGDDPFFDGGRDGALDPGRGVLLLELRHGGRSCWRFLEVVPFNLARWGGAVDAHYERVPTDLAR